MAGQRDRIALHLHGPRTPETDMPDLPAPIATYFAIPHDAAPARWREVFAADARVEDESRQYNGPEEIAAWRSEAYRKTPYVARVLSAASTDEQSWDVMVEVSGSFPNSPVVLKQTFVLDRDKIAVLDIR